MPTTLKSVPVFAGLFFPLVLLTVGCAGGKVGASQAVEWEVSRQVGPKRIRLVTSVETCSGDPVPRLKRPKVEYAGQRVFISLFVAPEIDPTPDGGCLLELLGVNQTIALKRNLDELVLFDSSTDPPERRWPGR